MGYWSDGVIGYRLSRVLRSRSCRARRPCAKNQPLSSSNRSWVSRRVPRRLRRGAPAGVLGRDGVSADALAKEEALAKSGARRPTKAGLPRLRRGNATPTGSQPELQEKHHYRGKETVISE